MDWYRTKCSHTLYDDMPAQVFKSWHKLMALTAHLEKIPNQSQINSILTQKQYKSVVSYFEVYHKSIVSLMQKVVEDAESVKQKREYNKEKKRQSREKSNNVKLTSNTTVNDCPELDKIREDKIREDKITTIIPIGSSGYEFYTNNIHLTPTQYESEQVVSLIQEFSDDWFINACKVSINNGVRKLSYIRAVLEKSKNNGGVDLKSKSENEAEKRARGKALADKLEREAGLS